ncbi:hypothetical protein [Pseudarthrobacter sp. PS3-L1]|uniref:hypothetical protein n=1 Tax=Pseudarthrobacter sp. PS3-L1 TaxID=3046207 RepID=UPI0024BA5BB2|nr:hypothetical protein [Pseudarthrobacter sp. PS3-L1]MDJ0322116.1 hypothetical protein [Pseudarthrobacter sp. PS3-L1]
MKTRTTLAAVLFSAVVLAGCSSPTTPTGDVEAVQSAPAVQESYPRIPDVTWDADAERELEDTATKAMELFARPGTDERTWFTELSPLLSPEYKTEAQFIDPARITVSELKADPVMNREAQNPLTATAAFQTNDGPWLVSIHRIGQNDPWLITSISPSNP